MDDKIAIIACAKFEQCYIREWIEWYKNLGIDHIFIADNNPSKYEYQLNTIISDYIYNGFVTIYNYNDISPIQPNCYIDIYNNQRYNYEWFFICDIDEFLHIPETNNSIKDFIHLPKFNQFNSIAINWRQYDDNDLLYYEDKPVQERFTRLCNTKHITNGESSIIKSIFKSIVNIDHQHDPLLKSELVNRCNVLGIKRTKHTRDMAGGYNDKYKCAYVAYYKFKTAEEYVLYKYFRGDALNNEILLKDFFILNRYTEQKNNIIYENYNKKLIYASSSTANNSNITSMYGLSKQFNEQFAKIYCPNSVGLRFHNVWSFIPREGTLMWHLLNDKCVSLYNNGNNVRCFTYIDDIITGIIKSFTLTESVYNIVNNEPISTLEFANIVKQKFDIHYKCIPDIRPLDKINQFVNTEIPTIDINYHKVNEIIKSVDN